ncbi:MAG: hypothetical protein GF347_01900 [Candidatus Moranbacteria bacterium]|nr:hypothetical protein [Candidatus Moranbacteria bacterium]
MVIFLALFFVCGQKTWADDSEDAICFTESHNSKKYFLKDGFRHKIASSYALKALGGCEDKGEWAQGMNFPEKGPIELNLEVCYLAKNRQECENLVKDYLKISKTTPMNDNLELIVFDFKALSNLQKSKPSNYMEYSVHINKADLDNCKTQVDSQKCIENLVQDACEPIYSLGERVEDDEAWQDCYEFFAKELNNPSICELIVDPQKYSYHSNSCYSNLAIENQNPDFCSKAEFKGECYKRLAEITKDPLLCDQAQNQKINCHKSFSEFGWDILTRFNLLRIIYVLILSVASIIVVIKATLKLKNQNRQMERPKKYFYIFMIIGGVFWALNAWRIFTLTEISPLVVEIFIPNGPLYLINIIVIYIFAVIVEIFVGIFGISSMPAFFPSLEGDYTLVLLLIIFDFLWILLLGYIMDRINWIKRRWLRILLMTIFVIALVATPIITYCIQVFPYG